MGEMSFVGSKKLRKEEVRTFSVTGALTPSLTHCKALALAIHLTNPRRYPSDPIQPNHLKLHSSKMAFFPKLTLVSITALGSYPHKTHSLTLI